MTFRVDRVELYELTLPLVTPFVISGGTMRQRRSLLVRLLDGEGGEGWGECPPFELPFYSEETLAGARWLLETLLVPRVAGASFAGPEAVDEALRRGVRGNPFARAAIETAAWDLEADRRGLGLADLLAERLAEPITNRIPCGVALGIPERQDVGALAAAVGAAVEQGYRRVKIKVMPGWDRAAVDAAHRAMADSGLPLTVDANGGYEWPQHEAALRSLDAAGLLYIEQPLPADELLGHVRLAAALSTPICLDETLRDARAARQIDELGGPLVWNVKVHRVGGLSEVCRIYGVARRTGAALWAGTMPESGLGSQAALAVAALPGFVYPSDVEPSARWFGAGADIIELTMDQAGTMAVPRRSIRHHLDHDRLAGAAVRLGGG